MRKDQGQSLTELIIAITIGVIFVTATIQIVALNLRHDLEIRTTQIASALAQEYIDAMQAIAESNWITLYCPPEGTCLGTAKGPASQFFIAPSSTTQYGIQNGATTTEREGKTFTRSFSIENVNRDSCGVGNITASATIPCPLFEQGPTYVAEDPSAQRINITIGWAGGHSLTRTQYFVRRQNRVLGQTDWSGGAGQINFPTSTQGTIVNNGYNSANTTAVSPAGLLTIAPGYASGTLTSSVFDTRVAKGASMNGIVWQGSANGGLVRFQITSSNCANGASDPPTCMAGGWQYRGPDGTANTFYEAGPNIPIKINPAYHTNYRYIGYFVRLERVGGPPYPQINDISINWSP